MKVNAPFSRFLWQTVISGLGGAKTIPLRNRKKRIYFY